MNNMVKKYVPYAAVIFAIYMIVPLLFRNQAMENFVAIAFYFIFPGTAIVGSAIYCAKYGLDFLFALIAPVAFLPSMLIYYGGFDPKYILTNIILLVVYLVAGIFGLFVGDIALGDKRREREEAEKAEAEEMMLEAKRRESIEMEKMINNESNSDYDEDFDYDRYTSDIDKSDVKSTEEEIDDILNEFGSSDKF